MLYNTYIKCVRNHLNKGTHLKEEKLKHLNTT